jgi:hypothetical protein
MAHRAMSRMTLAELPEHVLSCILRLLQQDALRPDSDADGVAALRCTCQSMRHAVDATMTRAVFHTHVGANELDEVLRSRTGRSCCCVYTLTRDMGI